MSANPDAKQVPFITPLTLLSAFLSSTKEKLFLACPLGPFVTRQLKNTLKYLTRLRRVVGNHLLVQSQLRQEKT